jgi:hypothetical protein
VFPVSSSSVINIVITVSERVAILCSEAHVKEIHIPRD